MNDRLLQFLGLCKRAGYLISGADTVTKAMREHKALLVLTVSDLSANTAGDIAYAVQRYGIAHRVLPCTKEELSFALGRHCGVICVTDKGFADKILKMIS